MTVHRLLPGEAPETRWCLACKAAKSRAGKTAPVDDGKTSAEILAAATDIIRRIDPALWVRLSPAGRMVEARAILCTDMLRQAPGTEAPMEWWRDVARALANNIDTLRSSN